MLTDWQAHLWNHFKDLRRTRTAKVGDKPIFALEHGLVEADLKSLRADIQKHIAKAPPSEAHALPWIVHAAEIGYRYEGDRFWPVFLEETKGWKTRDNGCLREWFHDFYEEFGGAKPTGPWAENFPIICWPITHAILPLDLQEQFAEILYSMRNSFSAELLTSPIALGERIAARSWKATSRVQNLAQEPLLIGQIATALLFQGEEGFESLILPATLKRIATDLDRVQAARGWLRNAQIVAKRRIHFRGLSAGTTSPVVRRPSPSEKAHEQVAALGIEPKLILRPTDTGAWDVLLQLPDFSPLLLKFPALRGVLTESRVTVAASSDRPLARGALLHGPQLVILRSWPGPDDALLRFEQSVPPQIDYLLRAEGLLRPGPRWVFRIASDGLAYGLKGNFVRPAQSYVLANSDEPFKAGLGVTPNVFTCEGIHGARLNIPSSISEEWARQLEALRLSQAKSVHVWPAGLAPANWDGEGNAEWITSDRPCVGLRPDHAVERIIVTLSSADQRLEVSSPVPGQPIYVELPPLAAGVHTLRISTHSVGVRSTAEVQAGELEIIVREPRAWDEGINAGRPLQIILDPPVPTLEQVWGGDVDIEIRGPTGREVVPTISLFEHRASTASVRKRLPPLSIPANAETWRVHFEKHFRNSKDVQSLYDPAHTCTLEISADELGTFFLKCEREFTPLRWVVRHQKSGYELTLLDDRGSGTMPQVSRYEFISPDRWTWLDAAPFSSGYAVPASGGLYRTRASQHDHGVIVAPPPAKTLGDLGIKPLVRDRKRSVNAIGAVLSITRLWSEAHVTGGLLSVTRRQAVLLALAKQVVEIVCGNEWARAEEGLHRPSGLKRLNRAISPTPAGISFAANLLADVPAYGAQATSGRVDRFASTARRFLKLKQPVGPLVKAGPGAAGSVLLRRGFRSDHPDWICEFALRLASSPATLHTWATDDLQRGLQRLLHLQVLVRGARFLVLAIDRDPDAPAGSFRRLYRGWDWE